MQKWRRSSACKSHNHLSVHYRPIASLSMTFRRAGDQAPTALKNTPLLLRSYCHCDANSNQWLLREVLACFRKGIYYHNSVDILPQWLSLLILRNTFSLPDTLFHYISSTDNASFQQWNPAMSIRSTDPNSGFLVSLRLARDLPELRHGSTQAQGTSESTCSLQWSEHSALCCGA